MCRSRRELSNAYLLAKVGFDTAENEPCKVCRIPPRAVPSDASQIPQVHAAKPGGQAGAGEGRRFPQGDCGLPHAAGRVGGRA